MATTIHTGDCRDALRSMPDASVHCVVTSPPYYGLRDYGTAQWDGGDPACNHTFVADAGTTSQREGRSYQQGHPHRDCKCGARRIDRQMGLEASPSEYIQSMVEVFREVRRVMRADATLWLNVGDAFTDKQLQMMPARLALALQADGFYLRSDIVWAKPNPMPESVTDRPTSAHEHVFLLTKAARYFYDADAVRENVGIETRRNVGFRDAQYMNGRATRGVDDGYIPMPRDEPSLAGRSCRNVWTIATEAFPEAHFATYPTALAARCIKAGTSERGCCAACGAPWVREVDKRALSPTIPGKGEEADRLGAGRNRNVTRMGDGYEVTTTGWSAGCRCDAPTVPCTVLDPFAGAGTTLLVADRLQRNAIGIELNPAYAAMARNRITRDAGLFAEVAD